MTDLAIAVPAKRFPRLPTFWSGMACGLHLGRPSHGRCRSACRHLRRREWHRDRSPLQRAVRFALGRRGQELLAACRPRCRPGPTGPQARTGPPDPPRLLAWLCKQSGPEPRVLDGRCDDHPGPAWHRPRRMVAAAHGGRPSPLRRRAGRSPGLLGPAPRSVGAREGHRHPGGRTAPPGRRQVLPLPGKAACPPQLRLASGDDLAGLSSLSRQNRGTPARSVSPPGSAGAGVPTPCRSSSTSSRTDLKLRGG